MDQRTIDVIQSEQDYARDKWLQAAKEHGVFYDDTNKPVEFWILHMQRFLDEARKRCGGLDKSAAMDSIRKVAGLGATAIENLDIPARSK